MVFIHQHRFSFFCASCRLKTFIGRSVLASQRLRLGSELVQSELFLQPEVTRLYNKPLTTRWLVFDPWSGWGRGDKTSQNDFPLLRLSNADWKCKRNLQPDVCSWKRSPQATGVSSLTCVMTLHSWGRWEGGFGAEEDNRPGEDLHHHTWGHLQFWLHRSVPLLFCDGRFGKTRSLPSSAHTLASALQAGKSHSIHIRNVSEVTHPFSLPEIPSCHVLLVGPRRHLQSSSAAICLHWAGETNIAEMKTFFITRSILFLEILSIIITGYCHKNN